MAVPGHREMVASAKTTNTEVLILNHRNHVLKAEQAKCAALVPAESNFWGDATSGPEDFCGRAADK